MKIIGVIGCPANKGGSERVMSLLCNYLCEHGHEVVLIALNPDGEDAYPIAKEVKRRGCTARASRIPGVRLMRRLRHMHRIFKEEKADIAFSFIILTNILAIFASLGTRTPLIVCERSNPDQFKGTAIGRIRALSYPFAQGYVFQTPQARDYFSDRIRKKAAVIYNPLTEGLPRKEDYTSSGRLVAVGRLTEAKDYPFLLRVMDRIHRRYPTVTLEIYGDGKEKSSLQQQIAAMGLEDTVLLMGNVTDVHQRIIDADLYLMASKHEGMSNALAEALAIGLPCVVNDCAGGSASCLVEDDRNGRLIPLGEEEKFTAAVAALLDDANYRRRLGEAAVDIREQLDLHEIMSCWDRYFKQILEEQ